MMVRITAITGAILLLLGVGGYAVTGGASITALIPALLGAVFLILARLGRRDHLRRHVMHAASALALIGFFGSAGGIPPALGVLAGSDVVRPEAAVARALMALVCAAYLVPAIRSFAAARRRGGTTE